MLLTVFQLKADINPDIVISQAFTTYVEIFNRSGHSVSIADWSVQYTFDAYSPSAPNWSSIPIDGILAPGQYYLVEVDGSNSLQADASGSFLQGNVVGLNSRGTVALVRSATPLTVSWPSILDVADLFGFGFGLGPGQEAIADGTPFPGQTGQWAFAPQAAFRLQGGYVENHNNATDFQLAAPEPRNSHTPHSACSTTPVIRSNGVVNAASSLVGPVAPGELLTVLGTNLGPTQETGSQSSPPARQVPADSGRVRVLFDGIAVPVVSASPGQVNVVAPTTLSGKSHTVIQVEYNGTLSGPQTLPVAPSAPGIFTSSGTGTGQAIALNQNSSMNSVDFPDSQGSLITIYATGVGLMSAGGENGSIRRGPPQPMLPVTVTVGGQNARVLGVRNTPERLGGVLLVGAQIPPSLAGRQDVILKVGSAESQSGVTVAVDLGATAPSSWFHVDVPATDIAYDAGTHRLYASIGNDGSAHANSVAVIDPSSGNVLNWIQTGTGPARLALSDDGRYLYLALHNPAVRFDSIQRIDIVSGNPDFTVTLGEIYSDPALLSNALQVSDMQVLAGQPRSLAIAVSEVNGWWAPVVIIDDNVRRPAVGTPAAWLRAGGPGALWGDTRAYVVTPLGLSPGSIYPVNSDTEPGAVAPAGGLLISSNGLVMSGAGNDLVAQLSAVSGALPGFVYRPDTGFAYYAGSVPGYTNFLLEAFDLQTYMPSGDLFFYDSQVPRADQFFGTPQRLISVGPAGLATISGGFAPVPRIFIFPLSIIRALPPVTVPLPSSSSAGLRRFAIPSNSIAVNPQGDYLYLSVPSVAPPIGNSILPFDVITGAFGSPVWVGSEPQLAAVSSDGQHLHAMLAGSRTMLRLRLPDLTVERAFHVTGDDGTLADANAVLSLPSNPTSVVVGRYMSLVGHTLGVAIYDDGVQRPKSTTNYFARTNAPGPMVDEAQISADGTTLYGEQGEVVGAVLSRWLITPEGFQFDSAGSGFGSQTYLDLSCQGTLCLTGSGYVASTSTLQFVTRLGDYPNHGLALMDLDNNRMFLLTYSGADTYIQSFDATSYKPTGQYVIPNWGSAHTFKKIFGGQLAIANSYELILLPISMLQPQ